jgi:hypothetical protein
VTAPVTALLVVVLSGWAVPVLAGPSHPAAGIPAGREHQEQAQEQPEGPVGSGESTTTTTTSPAAPDQDIIPDPNSGQPPSEAGDRGGALQLALLALIVIGVGVVAWRIAVSARRQPPSGANS